MSSELAAREERAQIGVLQFAEEMEAIRDAKLYPNAGKKDAWTTYCKERWGQSSSSVDGIIRARPVLTRLQSEESSLSVEKAKSVASLPEVVQDAILADAPKEHTVKARAKAARKEQKKAERHGVEPDPAAMTRAAMNAKPSKPVSKPHVPDELRDENLPPRLTPRDHECLPRRLAGDALFSLWRVNEKLKDAVLEPDDREAIDEKMERCITLARAIQSAVRGEGAISDDDLKQLLEEVI